MTYITNLIIERGGRGVVVISHALNTIIILFQMICHR